MFAQAMGKPAKRLNLGAVILSTLVFVSACGGGGGGSTDAGGNAGGGGQNTNSAPQINNANLDQSAQIGEAFDYDASQGGTTFSDPDGDNLSYAVSLTPDNTGLSTQGAQISGTPDTVVNVTAEITATDPMGLSVTDSFVIFIQPDNDVKALAGLSGLRFAVNQPVNFDPASWADQFEDPSGNGLDIEIELVTPVPGLEVENGALVGRPTTAGVHSASASQASSRAASTARSPTATRLTSPMRAFTGVATCSGTNVRTVWKSRRWGRSSLPSRWAIPSPMS